MSTNSGVIGSSEIRGSRTISVTTSFGRLPWRCSVPARRRQLHRAVAEAIAVERHKDIDAASPQLAAHYDQAGMVEPAIDAYRVAGGRAVAVSALEEAVTMFRRALSLLADLPPSPDS